MTSFIIVLLVLSSLVDMQDAWTPTEETREFKGFGRVPDARIVGKPRKYLSGQYRIKVEARPLLTSHGIEGEAAELERLKREVVDTSYRNSATENIPSLTTIRKSSDDNFKLSGDPSVPLNPLSPISSASAGGNYGSSTLYTSAIAGQNMQILPQNVVIPGMYTSASAGHVLSPFFYFHVPVASFFSSASAGHNPLPGNGVSTTSDNKSELHKGSNQDSVALFASANAGSRPIDSGDSGVPIQNNPTLETDLTKIPDERTNIHEKTFVEKPKDSTIYADTRKHDQPKTDVEERLLKSNPTPPSSNIVPKKNGDTSIPTPEEKNPTPPSSNIVPKKNGDTSIPSTPQTPEERPLLRNPSSSQPETVSKKNSDAETSPPTISEERLSKRNINSTVSGVGSKKDGGSTVPSPTRTLEDHGERKLERKSEEFVSYFMLKKNNSEFAVPDTSNYTNEDFYIDDFETITEAVPF